MELPPPEPSREFVLTDPRQLAIHRRLQLVGPELADYFRDCCAIMAGSTGLRSQTHLAAHLLREIDGRLRDVLEPMFDAEARNRLEEAEKNRQTHRGEIVEAANILRLNDEIRDLWIDYALPLHDFAHRQSLAGPRAVAEFRGRWELGQTVLDAVTRRFETVYLDALPRLNELAAKQTPSKADKKELRGRIPHSDVLLGDFFEQAELGWFEFLREVGYFSEPRPLRPSTDGSIGYVPWPPGRFLVRAAADEHLRDEVIAIFLDLDMDNPDAHESAVDAALAMRAADAAKLAPAIVRFLDVPYQWRLPIRVEELAVHLAAGREVAAAVSLAEALVDPLLSGTGAGWRSRLMLDTLVPKLFPAVGTEGLAVLQRLLVQVLDEDGREENDLSHIWRPTIEGGRDSRPRDVVISALRDAATSVVDADPVTVGEVVELLERDRRSIFRRLALYVLRRHPKPELVAERLGDHALFRDYNVERDYTLLAQGQFASLPSDIQERILGWIRDEPHWRPQDLDEADVDEWDDRWRLRQLRRLGGRETLPVDWQGRYEELIERFGEPPDPTPSERIAVWSGVTSPLTKVQILAMGIDQLVAYLDEWTPETDWRAPSVEGLANELREAVLEEPARFADALLRFADLEPIYGRFVVLALHQSLANGQVDWEPVIAFGEAILAKPAVIEGRTEGATVDVDPGWAWSRLEIVRLVERGLRRNLVPRELAERLWALIAPLASDPDPDLAKDDVDDNTGGPDFLSHNTVRGVALHAAVAFVWWSRPPDADVEAERRLPPRARELLERHLDPRVESTRTIRSVYGQSFNQLHYCDPDWAAAHVEMIFPPDPAQERLWLAAWRAFIDGNLFWPETWLLLEPQYRRAVEGLATLSATTADGDELLIGGDGELLGHLLSAYVRGRLEVGSDSLLDRFLEIAPVRLRAQLIEMVGIDLENAEEVSTETQERLQRLWEARFAAVAGTPDGATELAGFAWWFGSGKLPVEWSFEQLERLARTTGEIGFDYVVTQRLRELANTHLAAAMRCLALLVEHVQRSHMILSAGSEIREILGLSLNSGDAPTVAAARETISRLYVQGFRQFREVLGDRAQEGEGEAPEPPAD